MSRDGATTYLRLIACREPTHVSAPGRDPRSTSPEVEHELPASRGRTGERPREGESQARSSDSRHLRRTFHEIVPVERPAGCQAMTESIRGKDARHAREQ